MKNYAPSLKPLQKAVLGLLLLLPPFIMHAAQNAPKEPSKALVCHACHGPKGISLNPAYPHLAGQNAPYLKKQLLDIKDGKQRIVPAMKALVNSLNSKDIDDLAAYYAKMPPARGKTPKQYVLGGAQIYRRGDFNKRIMACIACHGPHGLGNPEAGFPRLSGQHAQYTLMQLKAFKDGNRTNDLNHIMHDISTHLDQDDMVAVAHYIEGLY